MLTVYLPYVLGGRSRVSLTSNAGPKMLKRKFAVIPLRSTGKVKQVKTKLYPPQIPQENTHTTTTPHGTTTAKIQNDTPIQGASVPGCFAMPGTPASGTAPRTSCGSSLKENTLLNCV